ncbi:MAG: tRNA uridine-5-carboxymethylaminomethyl(34) synthesis GTPase MnmE [Clostridia bacterium]|nr:tRNA uridine-5-carboxymethylaminomethyl(34) synthesis GTPase MnmE [Clostridia bacterium]
MQEDVIAAVATPLGAGGIGIVRISGEGAAETAQKIFRAKNGRKLAGMKPYTAAYGFAVNGDETIDECIALVFRAPKSFTGENVVELSCHGGVYVMRRLLEAAILAGARLAQPGEFTKRAFLNGRLDLTQAESVMELISAQSDSALRAANSRREGALYREIAAIKARLVETASELAAWMDFPDDVSAPERGALHALLERDAEALDGYLSGYERGRILREGVDTVIAGRANAGKSTLMNLLAGCERSIVTAQPGTTRDVIEEAVSFAGVALRLSDTAGIRSAQGEAEALGVARAKRRVTECDLVIAVFDGSAALDQNDLELIGMLEGRAAVAVINKADLPQVLDEEVIGKSFTRVVRLCARTGEGLEGLEKQIRQLTGAANFDFGTAALANERQLQCAARAGEALRSAIEAVDAGITLDAVSVCIDSAVSALCELTGERADEEIITRVFERFCVGK